MSDLDRLRVVVAGAGALGSVVALTLARRGAQVLLTDPAPRGGNASGVAAGMLAPVFECLLDAASTDHFPILSQARDAWQPLMRGLPAAPSLDRSGALLSLPDSAAGEAMAVRIAAVGAQGRLLDADAARTMAPDLAGDGAFLFTPDDWRLEPGAVLTALHNAVVALGGQTKTAAVVAFERGCVKFDRGQDWAADVVVLATGYRSGAGLDAGDEAPLEPIKGQILRFPGSRPYRGPVVRGEGVYAVPDADGVIVGATMEPGRSDLEADPDAVRRLHAAAAGLLPGLAGASPLVSVGVRAATPDGLPLAGPSRRSGVVLARGARRNGWLLAPVIADVIVDHLLERPTSPIGRRFDPARFG